MIRYVIAKSNDKLFQDYIQTHIKNVDPKLVSVVTNEMGSTISKKYNYGIDYHLMNGLTDNDVICFVHEDVKIHDKLFNEKLEMIFKARPDIGLVGVMGTTNFVEQGGWWLSRRPIETRGHILQDRPDLKEPFHMVDQIGFFDDLVSVDGCCMFMSGKLATEYTFDEDTYNGYHFYDCDCSFSALEMGYKVAVADILIEHASEGPLPDSWHKNRKCFIDKWTSKGLTFPVNINSFSK